MFTSYILPWHDNKINHFCRWSSRIWYKHLWNFSALKILTKGYSILSSCCLSVTLLFPASLWREPRKCSACSTSITTGTSQRLSLSRSAWRTRACITTWKRRSRSVEARERSRRRRRRLQTVPDFLWRRRTEWQPSGDIQIFAGRRNCSTIRTTEPCQHRLSWLGWTSFRSRCWVWWELLGDRSEAPNERSFHWSSSSIHSHQFYSVRLTDMTHNLEIYMLWSTLTIENMNKRF